MSHPHPAWYRILFVNAKTHLVPGSLREDLLQEMAARDCLPNTTFLEHGFEPIKRVKEYGLDTSGMCFADEPWVPMKIDNLQLGFPCTGVSGFLRQAHELAAKGPRHFAMEVTNRPYYKVHGNFHCMTLTPRQFGLLVAQLEAKVDEAEAIAHAFLEERIARDPISAAAAGASLIAMRAT